MNGDNGRFDPNDLAPNQKKKKTNDLRERCNQVTNGTSD